MPITHTKVSLVADDADTGLIRPSDWNAAHTDPDGWTSVITKASNQTVTNSATLTDDSELQIAVLANEIWMFELVLLYTGTSGSADYKWAFAVSSGNLGGWHRYLFSDTTADAINPSTGIRTNAVAATTALAVGVDAGGTVRFGFIEAIYRFSANATFKFQFAQNAQTASQSVTTRAGSILRGRRII